MSRVLSEFQFLGRLMQVCEASFCPSPGGPGQHVHEPSRGGSVTGPGQPGPARQGWEPRGAHPLSVTPWGLLVWSDTPDPPNLLALGLRAPSPGARAHPHPTQRQTDVSGGGFQQPVTCWGLPEAFPEKGCVYSMGTTT